MEKLQLVNFVSKVMEDGGFKVYKDFKTSQQIIDIYGVLPTALGDFGVVVACKNYDKQWEVGVDILKEMEIVGRSLKASKVAIVTSSSFSPQARKYASRRNIKLIDRDSLMVLAKKFSKKSKENQINQSNQATNQNISNSNIYTNSNTNNSNSNTNDSFNRDNYENSYENSRYNQNYEAHDNGESLNYTNYNSAQRYGNNESNQRYNDNDYEYDDAYFSGPSNISLGRVGASNQNNNARSNFSKLSNLGNNRRYKRQGPSLITRFKPILNNTIVLIAVVVLISYFISILLEIIANVPAGISGLVKILSALVLSYGIVLGLNREGTTVLVKGTTVFFISLIILILMIILL